MALRAIKPAAIQKRLKALFYGPAGVGKTTAAISFPKPYLIDCEHGAENDQYIKTLESSGGMIFQTNSVDEIITEVISLSTEKHDFKTLIIDPLTIGYNELLDKAAKNGTDFGKHYGEANKSIKRLCNLLLRLDMNVIITAHSKNEYGNNMAVLGQTFDCYKKLDYLFDLVFEIKKQGLDRVGVVKKSRVETFKESEFFPFSYQEISSRYGKQILEKISEVQKLATNEQVEELTHLIQLLHIDSSVSDKWLSKAGAETFYEMPEDVIKKCIEHLKEKISISKTKEV